MALLNFQVWHKNLMGVEPFPQNSALAHSWICRKKNDIGKPKYYVVSAREYNDGSNDEYVKIPLSKIADITQSFFDEKKNQLIKSFKEARSKYYQIAQRIDDKTQLADTNGIDKISSEIIGNVNEIQKCIEMTNVLSKMHEIKQKKNRKNLFRKVNFLINRFFFDETKRIKKLNVAALKMEALFSKQVKCIEMTLTEIEELLAKTEKTNESEILNKMIDNLKKVIDALSEKLNDEIVTSESWAQALVKVGTQLENPSSASHSIICKSSIENAWRVISQDEYQKKKMHYKKLSLSEIVNISKSVILTEILELARECGDILDCLNDANKNKNKIIASIGDLKKRIEKFDNPAPMANALLRMGKQAYLKRKDYQFTPTGIWRGVNYLIWRIFFDKTSDIQHLKEKVDATYENRSDFIQKISERVLEKHKSASTSIEDKEALGLIAKALL